jgi:hypothetical protein
MRGDLKARSVFGLVFPKEASGMDIAALYLFEEPFRYLSSRRGRFLKVFKMRKAREVAVGLRTLYMEVYSNLYSQFQVLVSTKSVQ